MSENNSDDYGIVYVLTNPLMPNLVKVGMTTRCDISERMRELYTTGVPVPFECAYACKVKKSDCCKVEGALHTAFAPNRINSAREFFKIEPEQAIVILKLLNCEDISKEVDKDIDDSLTVEDKAASAKVKSSRRPPLDFFEMGLQSGDTLVFKEDPNITVEIVDKRKVSYKGEERSLTDVTRELLNIPYAAQPTGHWLINNENLRDVYDRTYPLET